MEVQAYDRPILKDVYTNSLYQSKFMPIFEKAEIRIKELVLSFFFFGRSKYLLRVAIAKIILDVEKQIPNDLRDKDQYLKGLQVKSDLFVRKYYDEQQTTFTQVKEKILSTTPPGTKAPLLKTPKETVDFIQSKKMWAEAKGSPNVVDYPKQLARKLNQLAAEPVTTQEPGKKPISLWQKAELDVRYENQMQNLQNLRVTGVEYAWTSSHPNASKRCAPWQGKLMALEGHARYSNFRVGKLDGHWVYSLVDIMNQTDKYGYHNNIICGFNCRHRLIPYKGQLPPKEYNKDEIDQQRKIEAQIREMERNIRLHKKRARLYNEVGEYKLAKQIESKIKQLVAQYKAFCERNGYAWQEYRIKV